LKDPVHEGRRPGSGLRQLLPLEHVRVLQIRVSIRKPTSSGLPSGTSRSPGPASIPSIVSVAQIAAQFSIRSVSAGNALAASTKACGVSEIGRRIVPCGIECIAPVGDVRVMDPVAASIFGGRIDRPRAINRRCRPPGYAPVTVSRRMAFPSSLFECASERDRYRLARQSKQRIRGRWIVRSDGNCSQLRGLLVSQLRSVEPERERRAHSAPPFSPPVEHSFGRR
jgi:hypothetical protein